MIGFDWKKATGVLIMGVGLALSSIGITSADTRVKVGLLTCDVEGGSGYIFGSNKGMECIFESTSGYAEDYSGNVRKFGIDIGTTDAATIKWVVFAPSRDPGRGALRGGYVGVSAEATLGVGLGGNVLVGGFEDSIVLQPFSGQYQEGLNIAIGIGAMRLSSR